MMEIKNIRIEERLIHGQVVTVWRQALRPTRFIVIDDDVSTNDMQKQILKLACPVGTKLSIFSVDRAIQRLAENPYDGESVFILIKNPAQLKKLYDKGFEIKTVNVGNMSGKDGATEVKRGVCVTHEEAEIFRELHDKGVEFTALMVPNDPDVDFMKLIEKI
jgi:PTS system mannose-specific IIB component